MASPRALLFDLDGTLIHSAPAITDTLNSFLVEAGLAPIEEAVVLDFIGDGAAATLERGFRRRGRELGATEADSMAGVYAQRMAAHRHSPADLYPGVAETLAALAASGHPMAVVTNKPRPAAVQALLDTGLADFLGDRIVTPDDGFGRKPEPGPILHALGLLGLGGRSGAGGAVLIGDSPADRDAARATDLPFFVAAWGYTRGPAEALGGTAVLAGMSDLPRALEALGTAA